MGFFVGDERLDLCTCAFPENIQRNACTVYRYSYMYEYLGSWVTALPSFLSSNNALSVNTLSSYTDDPVPCALASIYAKRNLRMRILSE